MSTDVIKEVTNKINLMEPQFQKVLPPHITPEKFARVVITALKKTPKLLEVNRDSLFEACMFAAVDGLLPDGREGAIVPYKGRAKWLPMVYGILKKIRNSGHLQLIHTAVVHSKEPFTYSITEKGPQLTHSPIIGKDRGEIVSVYAFAHTTDGGRYVEVMGKDEIDKVRACSQSNSGPWFDWYEEMAKKTVIRRLSKLLPMSSDLEDVIRRDDDMYEFPEVQRIPYVTPDYLPGVNPRMTAEMFVEANKGMVNSSDIFDAMVKYFNETGQGEWGEKLTQAMNKSGVKSNAS